MLNRPSKVRNGKCVFEKEKRKTHYALSLRDGKIKLVRARIRTVAVPYPLTKWLPHPVAISFPT
jgi:hypothetical protein